MSCVPEVLSVSGCQDPQIYRQLKCTSARIPVPQVGFMSCATHLPKKWLADFFNPDIEEVSDVNKQYYNRVKITGQQLEAPILIQKPIVRNMTLFACSSKPADYANLGNWLSLPLEDLTFYCSISSKAIFL